MTKAQCQHPFIIMIAGQLPYCLECKCFVIEPVRVIITAQEAAR